MLQCQQLVTMVTCMIFMLVCVCVWERVVSIMIKNTNPIIYESNISRHFILFFPPQEDFLGGQMVREQIHWHGLFNFFYLFLFSTTHQPHLILLYGGRTDLETVRIKEECHPEIMFHHKREPKGAHDTISLWWKRACRVTFPQQAQESNYQDRSK